MAFVTVLWLQGGGLQALISPVDVLTSVGRLTGLVASDLLLVQVLLMARIPLVERSYGQDELARIHRLVGFTSFTLMVAHIVLVTFGYAAQDSGRGVIAEAVHLVLDYPGMMLATAGTGALVMVVVTSVRRARARLGYESWHLLHLYAYLGAGLALPHQLWTGTDFTSRPLATAFWWVAWAGTAAAVVICRIALPIWRTAYHRLVVDRLVTESPGVVSVHLTGRRLDRLPVRAGQFFIFRFLDGPGWTRGNPYSLSAAPDGRSLRITVKDLGHGSRRLANLRPGTRALIEGPYGRLTSDVRTCGKMAVLTAGIGITPGLALLHEHHEPGAVLVHRTSRPDDPLFADELEALQAQGVRVLRLAGSRAVGRDSWLPGRAADRSDHQALLHLIPDLLERDLYVCGSTAWAEAAVAAGLPAQQLHLERFGW